MAIRYSEIKIYFLTQIEILVRFLRKIMKFLKNSYFSKYGILKNEISWIKIIIKVIIKQNGLFC